MLFGASWTKNRQPFLYSSHGNVRNCGRRHGIQCGFQICIFFGYFLHAGSKLVHFFQQITGFLVRTGVLLHGIQDLKSLSMLFGKSVGFTGFLFRLLHVFVKIDTIGLFIRIGYALPIFFGKLPVFCFLH